MEQNGTHFLPTPARVRQSPVQENFTSYAYARSYFWIEDEPHSSNAAFIRKGKRARPACIHSRCCLLPCWRGKKALTRHEAHPGTMILHF